MEWRFTTDKPVDQWMAVDFDDSAWRTGEGGFGTRDTPGAVVGTVWNSSDIWLRRTFELPADASLQNPHFLVHHDEDVDIYINGKLALRASGYIGSYETVEWTAAARQLIKAGRNTIAVHCHQTTGGQFIDVGIIEVQAAEHSSVK
jgi:beta-galactosidase